MGERQKMFYFYIFRCEDGTLYCGSTSSIQNREARHNSGYGAQWTKQHGSGKIIYFEKFLTLVEARRREAQVKKWSRIKKENLIKGMK